MLLLQSGKIISTCIFSCEITFSFLAVNLVLISPGLIQLIFGTAPWGLAVTLPVPFVYLKLSSKKGHLALLKCKKTFQWQTSHSCTELVAPVILNLLPEFALGETREKCTLFRIFDISCSFCAVDISDSSIFAENY